MVVVCSVPLLFLAPERRCELLPLTATVLPATERFSPFVAQLSIGWRPIMSQLCIQNAASGSAMMSSSMVSMMPRSAVRFGSMFLAKNRAVAILPR